MPESVGNGTFIAYLADDGDLKAITYTGVWAHSTTGLSNDSYLNTGSTGLVGSQAALTFKGSIFAAVAALPAGLTDTDALNPPSAFIAIEGGPATTVTVDAANNTFLYLNKALEIGAHTITLTVLEQTDAFPLALDLFVYAGPDDVTVPVGATQPLSADDDAGTTGFLQGLLPAIERAQARGSGPPVGPIVGGVIGGVALVAIASLVVWYLCIRPRRRGGSPFFYAPAKISDMLSSETVDAKPEPYPLMLPTHGAPVSGRSMSQVPSLAPMHQPTFAQSEASLEQGAESSGYGAGVGKENKGVLSAPPPATYHADSGIRFGGSAGDPASDVLSDVPPTYSTS